MAQVKKKAVRDAILAAAKRLFTERGYSGTTLADIAGESGVTTSNIYNYFPSKLRVLYALYEPWLDQRLDKLAAEASKIDDPRKRLRKVLMSVLRDIPSANNCFANNVLQALSTLAIDEPYSRDLLMRSEEKVAQMIRDAIPEARRNAVDEKLLAHLLFMAFDGFAVNYRISGPSKQRAEAIVDMLSELILGSADTAPRSRSRPRAASDTTKRAAAC
jgi:AcrR family transcriptional regulator